MDLNKLTLFFKIMKYHGNYCGPNWSGGRHQGSVRGSRVPPIDEFDSTCKDHDAIYASARTNKERNDADEIFYSKNFGKGIKRTAAALAVGMQKKLRTTVGYDLSGQLPSFVSSKKSVEVLNVPTLTMARTKRRASAVSRPSKKRKIVRKRKVRVTKKRRSVKRRSRRTYKGKRAKKMKSSKFASNGVVIKHENGGSAATNPQDSLYIGHTVAPQRVVQAAYYALVKLMFAKAGIMFQNFDDTVTSRMMQFANARFVRISVQYRLDETNSAAVSSAWYGYDLDPALAGGAWTFASLADNLRDNVKATIVETVANAGTTRIFQFVLTHQASDDGASATLSNVIVDEELMVDIDYSSKLVCQNRSLNEANSTGTDNVDTVPMVGKHYKSTAGWLNGFKLKGITHRASGGDLPLFGDGFSGIIQTSSFATQTTILRKPPAGWQLTAKATPVMFAPGTFLNDMIIFKTHISWNNLMIKLWKYAYTNVASANENVEFGFAHMFGLESFINDRAGTNQIALAYECNQQVRMKCSSKKIRTSAIVAVN